MTTLLTGAGGFLGLNILSALGAEGVPCVALNDRVLPDDIAHRPGVTPEIADVRDRAAMAAILRRHGVTRILHAAAVTPAPGSALAGAETALDVNTVSTAILLEEARRAGVVRFVYPSSTAVYGAALYDGAPVTELTPPRPTSVYGYTKLASERLVVETAASFGLSCVRARITALFGPHERESGSRDMLSLPFQMARAALSGAAAIYPADLRRDWTAARDVATALVRLLTVRDLPADLYNLGIGQTWGPDLLARHLTAVRPDFRHAPGAADGSDCTLTLHDDPRVLRQPLDAQNFARDFDFRFRDPDQACQDYVQWLGIQGNGGKSGDAT